MQLTNMKNMLKKAYAGKYAIPHININNLEWTMGALRAAQKNGSPIILGTSEGAIKYMGGPETIVGMVKGLLHYLKITVPVALHLDHGSFAAAKVCLKAGFSSVMYDGSHEPFDINYQNVKEIVALAKSYNASVEAEVGTIGGEEDGVIGRGDVADPKEFAQMAALNIDALAAGINNIHGKYPPDWKGLKFDVLKQLQNAYQIPMVLHGGSGIPSDQVHRAIQMGVAKVNVNTECQLVFTAAVKKYFAENHDQDDKGFDPRKVLAPGVTAIEAMVKTKIIEFGSDHKA